MTDDTESTDDGDLRLQVAVLGHGRHHAMPVGRFAVTEASRRAQRPIRPSSVGCRVLTPSFVLSLADRAE